MTPPSPPAPLPYCLAATGFDGTHLLLLLGVAAVLLVAGVIAMRKAKARIVLALLPLAALALVFGGQAAPAQAIAQKIPDFTISDSWTLDGVVYESEFPTPEHSALIGQLDELQEDYGLDATFTLWITQGETVVPVDLDALDVIDLDGVAAITETYVDTARDDLPEPTDPFSLTLTVEIPYYDDCAKVVSTTVTWTGVLDYPDPIE